jgi:DNA-binding XRE family transcriptional regulator
MTIHSGTRPDTNTTDEIHPIGSDHETARRRRQGNPEYAKAAAVRAPFEQLARLVIRHRIENNLTQEDLAEAMGTSPTAISRLESGNHQPNLETLRTFGRVAGLGQLLVGFQDEAGHRELVGV